MTSIRIQEHFAAAMEDRNAPVVALSGNWGTGKSHLWSEYKKGRGSDFKSVYVSIFGVRSINELKLKLLAQCLEDQEFLTDHAKYITKGAAFISNIAKKFNRAAEVVDDIALLSLPRVLRDKLLVIDDVERKHKSLEIDEVLGFIDEFSTKHQVRFLLILNHDKLADKSIWEKFREKVINYEISIEITPDEAFEIAKSKSPSRYADSIGKYNKIVGMTNIRVLVRAIEFINNIFKNQADLEEKVQARFISSALLLCAIHFKMFADGPTLEYVLGYDPFNEAAKGELEDLSESEKSWARLMDQLGWNKSNQFEKEVAAALRTGLFNHFALDRAITEFREPVKAELAERSVKNFLHDCAWDPSKSVADLSADALDMLKIVEHMDARVISALCQAVSNIDQKDIEEQLIQKWTSHVVRLPESAMNSLGGNFTKFHPRIVEHIHAIAQKAPVLSEGLFDVIERIERNCHSESDERIIENATVEQYFDLIGGLKKDPLFMVVNVHLKWAQPAAHQRWKNIGAAKFAEACKRLIQEKPTTRLAAILQSKVIGNKVFTRLESQADLDGGVGG